MTMVISFIFILTFYIEKYVCSTSTSSQVAMVHSIKVLYCIPTMFVAGSILRQSMKNFHFSPNVDLLFCIISWDLIMCSFFSNWSFNIRRAHLFTIFSLLIYNVFGTDDNNVFNVIIMFFAKESLSIWNFKLRIMQYSNPNFNILP